MTTRRNRRVQPRPRVYEPTLRSHDTNTSAFREPLVFPGKGKRLRVLRVRAIQEVADGRRLYEVYFGEGESIATDAGKAVDTLDIPELGEDSTRIFPRDEGPRGSAGRAPERQVEWDPAGDLSQDNCRVHRGKLTRQKNALPVGATSVVALSTGKEPSRGLPQGALVQ